MRLQLSGLHQAASLRATPLKWCAFVSHRGSVFGYIMPFLSGRQFQR